MDEIGQYNMEIYLSMLGPVATDALSTLESMRLPNPVLPTATYWAIKSDSLPWQMTGGGGRSGFGRGPGGFGGRPVGFGGAPGVGMGLDLNSTMYMAFFRELGERLQPVAQILMQQIQEGKDEKTPDWGYKLLACDAAESIAQLSAALVSGDQVKREHATNILGYMGEAAASARSKLEAARDNAPTEREKRLIEWALREIKAD